MSRELNYVLSLIIVLLLGYIIYDKVEENITDKNSNNNVVEEVKNEKRFYSFSKDGKELSLYLLDNNKYYYGEFKNEEVMKFTIGNYTIDKDKITLNEEITSTGDGCYYTDRNTKNTFEYYDTTIITNSNEMMILTQADVYPIVDVELIDGIRNCTK